MPGYYFEGVYTYPVQLSGESLDLIYQTMLEVLKKFPRKERKRLMKDEKFLCSLAHDIALLFGVDVEWKHLTIKKVGNLFT